MIEERQRPVVCDIVIPIWNLAELTGRCLESVRRCTAVPVRLILIDNHSDAPTQDLLKRFQTESDLPVQVIRNPENLGFIRAVNQGIRAASAPWICLLNNDTVVTSGWLREMIRVAESDPTIGLVNPTSNSLGYPAGETPPEEIARQLAGKAGRSAPLSTALGFCLLAPRNFFDRVGLLDERFGMGNFDDDDLSWRARQAGLRPVRALAAYVHHEEKASFKRLAGAEKAFQENRRRFEEKWGRRLRILVGPKGSPKALAALAEQGHWIVVVSPRNGGTTEWPALLEHAQVSYLECSPCFWRPRALWRLIAKRKKPFDLVVSHDPVWSRWIHRLRIFHRAKRLDQPTESDLLKQCKILSQSQSPS
jgi:GT2 family glycosyltransferase